MQEKQILILISIWLVLQHAWAFSFKYRGNCVNGVKRRSLCIESSSSVTGIDVKSSKLKVLCLHGFDSSSRMFELQLSALQSATSDFAEFMFIDGAHCLKTLRKKKSQKYAWWAAMPTETGEVEYRGMQQSIDALLETSRAFGPFHVILGHSQGAALIAAANLHTNSGSGSDEPPILSPKLVILLAGFLPQDRYTANLAEAEREQKSISQTQKSLHVYGTNDAVLPVEGVKQIASLYTEPKYFAHTGGHDPPRDEGTVGWIAENMRDVYNDEFGNK